MNNRKLVLESGKVFEGVGFGSNEEVISEITFNTSVVGYQEILSDPANYHKIICMTYPVVGNYGLNDEDYESKGLVVSGLVVRDYNELPSNFRFTHKLSEAMEECKVSGISEIDTRELTRYIRDNGSMKALICDSNKPHQECLELLRNYAFNSDITALVSTKKVTYSRTHNPNYNVVVVDCGANKSLVKGLNSVGYNEVLVPYNSTYENILKYKPDGLVISNGPGNPTDLKEVIDLIVQAKGKLPVLGIGLGCDLVALAYGAKVEKSKFGQHGCNIPIKYLETQKIDIAITNTSYDINEESLNDTKLSVLTKNVIDKSVMGVIDQKSKVIGIKNLPIEYSSNDEIFKTFNQFLKKIGGRAYAKKN